MTEHSKDFCIIAEKGKTRYNEGKMQGAGIEMIIVEAPDFEKTLLTKTKNKKDYTVYVIGDVISKSVGKLEKTLVDSSITIEVAKNEDEIMLLRGKSFPEDAKEWIKEKKKVDSEIKKSLEGFMGSSDKFSEEDIVCVVFAVEELRNTKIFPVTYESMRKALVDKINMYIDDTGKTDELVDFYLNVIVKKME